MGATRGALVRRAQPVTDSPGVCAQRLYHNTAVHAGARAHAEAYACVDRERECVCVCVFVCVCAAMYV